MRIVLRKCKLPMLTQEDIQNMNSPIAINNIKSVVKNLATKVTPARLEISLQKKKKKNAERETGLPHNYQPPHKPWSEKK